MTGNSHNVPKIPNRFFLGLCLFMSCSTVLLTSIALAEEPAQGPPIDLSALANIASSIGSNSQVMSMVSSLLNQGNSGAEPVPPPDASALGATMAVAGTGPSVAQTSESIPNPGMPSREDTPISDVPLRRGARQPELDTPAEGAAPISNSMLNQRSQPPQQPIQQFKLPALSGGLGNLVAMLPNVLPNLNLNGLLSSFVKPPVQPMAASPNSASTLDQGIPQQPASSRMSAPILSNKYQAPPTQPPSAQSVINQILTAYASGQIPNEIIQLGLSGRVPAQIIELALSGQIPPAMIQMIITGQVPMSTINAFLSAMQPQGESRRGSLDSQYSHQPRTQQFSFGGGVIGTTRALFEDLFKGSPKEPGQSGSGLSVPTLLGPIPLSMPKFPTARRIGQLLGGTITNVASMIPS